MLLHILPVRGSRLGEAAWLAHHRAVQAARGEHRVLPKMFGIVIPIGFYANQKQCLYQILFVLVAIIRIFT